MGECAAETTDCDSLLNTLLFPSVTFYQGRIKDGQVGQLLGCPKCKGCSDISGIIGVLVKSGSHTLKNFFESMGNLEMRPQKSCQTCPKPKKV